MWYGLVRAKKLGTDAAAWLTMNTEVMNYIVAKLCIVTDMEATLQLLSTQFPCSLLRRLFLQKLKSLLPPKPMAELTGPLKRFEDALPLLENDPRFERVADSDRYIPYLVILCTIACCLSSCWANPKRSSPHTVRSVHTLTAAGHKYVAMKQT